MATLISLIVILAVIGILWWMLMQIPLPQPIRIGAVLIFGLIAIVVLLNFVGLPTMHLAR